MNVGIVQKCEYAVISKMEVMDRQLLNYVIR